MKGAESALRMVTTEEVGFYRREGFLQLDLAEILGEAAMGRLRAGFLRAESEDFAQRTKVTWNDNPEVQFVRHYEMYRHYPEFAEIAHSRRLGEVAARLIGADHVRLYQDETFIKHPGMPVTIWHQDQPFVPVDRRGFMTIWIAIDDITVEMGAMKYLPRSHRLGPLARAINYDSTKMGEMSPETLRAARANDDYHRMLRDDDYDYIGEETTLPLRSGEAVIHDGFLLHGAHPNLSDRIRRGYAIVMIPEDAQYTGMPRPEVGNLGLVPFGKFDHLNFPVVY